MRCPVCGRENPNGGMYCYSCGAKLGRNSSGLDKKRTIQVVIIALLVIILLGEGCYLLLVKTMKKQSGTVTADSGVTGEKESGKTPDAEPAAESQTDSEEKADPDSSPVVHTDPKDEEPETNVDPGQEPESNPAAEPQEEPEQKTDPKKEPEQKTELREESESASEQHILPESEPDNGIYYYLNGHTYCFYDASDYGLKTYRMASSFCRKQGGHLAVMNDREENQFLYNLAVQEYEDTTVFFGYTDKDEEGTWVWDGAESDYTNWSRSGDWDLPDNGADWGGDEDFAEFNYDKYPKYGQPNDGTWNDASFMENTTIFLCEWEYDLRDVEQ